MKSESKHESNIVRRLWSPIRNFFTGYDIFISYSRADGKRYATELANRLADAGFSCLFDRWSSWPGETIPSKLKRSIRRTSLCVVVCSKGAAGSGYVKEEVIEFVPTGRSIVPIDIDDNARGASWWPMLRGLTWEGDSAAALEEGEPSAIVMSAIVGACSFVTKERRLQRAAAVLITLLLGLLLTSAVATWRAKASLNEAVDAGRAAGAANAAALAAQNQALSAAAEAAHQSKLASDATKLAKEKTGQAERAAADLKVAQAGLEQLSASNLSLEQTRERLQTEVSASQTRLTDANTELTEQVQLKDAADRARRDAEDLRDRAARQALEADGSRIAAGMGNAKELRESILAAMDDFGRMRPYIKTVPGNLHLSLTDALIQVRRRGRTLGVGPYPKAADFDVAPNRNLMVTCGEALISPDRVHNAVILWNISEAEAVAEVERSEAKLSTCAFSPDFERIAVGDMNGGLRLYAFSDGRAKQEWSNSLPAPILRVRFAPGGQRLVVLTGTESNLVNFYLIDATGGSPTPLTLSKRFDHFVTTVHFSGLPLSGPGAPPVLGTLERAINRQTGRFDWTLKAVLTDTGERREWDLGQPSVRRYVGKEGFGESIIGAVSPNARWLVTIPSALGSPQTSAFAVDLDCVSALRRQCVAVHRLPDLSYNFVFGLEIGFSPDGQFLVVRDAPRVSRIYRMSAIERGDDRPERVIMTDGELKAFTARGDGVIALAGHLHTSVDGHLGNFLDLPRNASLGPPIFVVWPLSGKEATDEYPTDLDLGGADGIHVRDVGGRFLVGTSGGRLQIWERSPSPAHKLWRPGTDESASLGRATDASVSFDGRLVATSYLSGRVGIWQIPRRELEGVIDGLQGEITGMQWTGSVQQPILYIASSGGQLIRWAVGLELVSIDLPPEVSTIRELQVSREGEIVLIRSQRGTLYIRSNARWISVPAPDGSEVALSSDGTRYAIQSNSAKIDIYDLNSSKVAVLNPTSGALRASRIRFANADTRIVGELRGPGVLDVAVWDSRGGDPLADAPQTPESRRAPAPAGHDAQNRPLEMLQGLAAGELWVVQIKDETYVVSLKDGRRLFVGRSRYRPSEDLVGAGRPIFAVDVQAHVVAAGSVSTENNPATGKPEAEVFDFLSGEGHAYFPLSPQTKRIEFLPGGQELLYIAPDNLPSLAPISIESKFKDLCATVFAGFSAADKALLHRDAFGLCIESPNRELNLPMPKSFPWTLTAPRRRP